MAKHTKHRFFLTSKKILWSVLMVVVVGGLLYYRHQTNGAVNNTTDKNKPSNTYINLNPPTSQDVAANDAHKSDLATDKPAQTTVVNGKKQVTPIITSTQQDGVNAYVPGVFEDGGICTLTASSGSKSINKTVTGFENASYTTCPPFNYQFSSGTWTLKVSYTSATAQGESQETSFKVN
jgi:cytoskeletal protein RodZ